MKKLAIAMILASAMIMSAFTCVATGVDSETLTPATVAAAVPEETALAVTEQVTTADTAEASGQKETAPPETDPPATEAFTTTNPPETDPLETEPPATTKPAETEPSETEPPVTTAPPHAHSYSAEAVIAPGCTSGGYTVYKCDCGASYTDDEVSATGHTWSEWTTTKEATSSDEGEKSRVCDSCGETETAAIEKLPAEQIDTAALEAFGRQYGKNTYGYDPVIGTRAGYYPGLAVTISDMEDGRQEVAKAVDATTEQLVAAGAPIVVVIDGKECAAMLDVQVVHEGNNDYRIWVYYG